MKISTLAALTFVALTFAATGCNNEFLIDGERVLMTTGSHHMQAYWTGADSGRAVELAQLVYVFEDERWVPRRDLFLQPPGPDRRSDNWSENCITCHATQGQPRL